MLLHPLFIERFSRTFEAICVFLCNYIKVLNLYYLKYGLRSFSEQFPFSSWKLHKLLVEHHSTLFIFGLLNSYEYRFGFIRRRVDFVRHKLVPESCALISRLMIILSVLKILKKPTVWSQLPHVHCSIKIFPPKIKVKFQVTYIYDRLSIYIGYFVL